MFQGLKCVKYTFSLETVQRNEFRPNSTLYLSILSARNAPGHPEQNSLPNLSLVQLNPRATARAVSGVIHRYEIFLI